MSLASVIAAFETFSAGITAVETGITLAFVGVIIGMVIAVARGRGRR